MRSILITVLFFVFSGVHAETVTIDFEEIEIDWLDPGLLEPTPAPETITSKGFVISLPSNPLSQFAPAWRDSGPGWAPGNVGLSTDLFEITTVDGQAFDFLGFDAYGPQPGVNHDFQLSAITSQGETIIVQDYYEAGNTLHSQNYSGQFDDIVSLTVQHTDTIYDIGDPMGQIQFTFDNIVLTTVPIPAAVWLFASGLGLLGWMRRKKSA